MNIFFGDNMYRRCTQYIYNYNYGIRENSCGYFRVDVRENECKITISIKVPRPYHMAVAEIYVIQKTMEGERIKFLAKTTGLCGEICYKSISRIDNVAGDISVNDIVGFIVYDGENKAKAFAGNMRGTAVDIYALLSDFENGNCESMCDEHMDEDCENILLDENVCDEYIDEDKYKESIHNCDAQNMDSGQTEQICENCVDDKIEMCDSETEKSSEDKEEKCENDMDKEEKCENDIDEKEKCEKAPEDESEKYKIEDKCWQELIFSNFPKIRIPFGEDNAEAVKLRPHDLGWFPKKYWQLSSNQCLLRGYYNYRYILLVRCGDDRDRKYYLAVQGKNCPMEAAISMKSGFEEFKKGYGNIGFWCRKAD